LKKGFVVAPALLFLVALTSYAGIAEQEAPNEPDLVCYDIEDPLVVSGSIVTSSVGLGVSPPCRIDGSATQICVPVIGDEASNPPSDAGQPAARLCYVVECPDDVPPPSGAVVDAWGKHGVEGLQASRICVPASLEAPGNGADAADEQTGNSATGDSKNTGPSADFGLDRGCGDANADSSISASDALAALRSAVGVSSGCGSCACDVNSSSSITASDALTILRLAVGQPVTLNCPEGPFQVSWDGGGDGNSWSDRMNWQGDAVPRFCDAVTIDAAADTTVLYSSQTLSIQSLTSNQSLTVNGGSLTLREASSVGGKLTFGGGTLEVVDTLDVTDFDLIGG
jgi:bacterioferritin-associated ferredoxin